MALENEADANGNKTTASFNDSFGNGEHCAPPAGQQTYIHPTQTTNALGYISKMSSWSCSGLIQSIQDPDDLMREGTVQRMSMTTPVISLRPRTLTRAIRRLATMVMLCL
jgi:hypothetical protein